VSNTFGKGKGMWILFERNFPFLHNLELLSGGRVPKATRGQLLNNGHALYIE